MSIPSSTLDTWTNQGSTTNSSDTYSSITNAVENSRYGLASDDFEHSYDIHLQGSYANDTNTYGSSDVDIVVRITMPFEEDLSELSEAETERFWEEYTDRDYEWEDFYSRVLQALRGYFGRENLEQGDKAIKVKNTEDTPIQKDADVVPSADYRKYHSFSDDGDEDYTTGMFFKTQFLGRKIVNYSKIHRDNGTEKNKNTDGEYKPTIRMFKNARDTAVSRDILGDGKSSSYYLEGLLYNVPNDEFQESDLQDRYLNIVEYLTDADISEFPEQSEMYPLCDSDDPERWTVEDADTTVNALMTLWEDY